MNVHFPTIPKALMSQKFGAYNPGLYGRETPHHMGEDYCPMPKNPVYAPCDGLVVMSASTGKSGYGGQVRIKTYDSAVVIVGHLTRWDVSKDSTVRAGQQIGLSGGDKSDPNSGFSTGPHIHFEYRPPGKTATDQGAIHPTNALLKYVPATLTKITIKSTLGMRVRSEPSTSGYILGDALQFRHTDYITEVRNGWGRLERLPGRDEWIFVDNPYWIEIGEVTHRVAETGTPTPPPMPEPPGGLDWMAWRGEIEKRLKLLEEIAGFSK